MSTQVQVEDERALVAAIQDVRNDATPTNWVLAKHVDNNPNLIALLGSGSGGFDEMRSHFDDNGVMYGLFRSKLTIDLSTTVKFIYIYLMGPNVPVTNRAKIGVVHGSAKTFFEPYHINFEITSSDEITENDINQKLAENSGRVDKSRDVDRDEVRHERGFTATSTQSSGPRKSNFGFQGNAPSSRQTVGIPFHSDVTDAIKDVRDDASETSWAYASYEDGDVKKQVVLVAKGVGGAGGMAKLMDANSIGYGILRVTDVIDGHRTTKFVFVSIIGNSVSIMTKAKVSTHKGDVTSVFSPFHVAIEISGPHELNDDMVMDRVQSASGSKSFVKA